MRSRHFACAPEDCDEFYSFRRLFGCAIEAAPFKIEFGRTDQREGKAMFCIGCAQRHRSAGKFIRRTWIIFREPADGAKRVGTRSFAAVGHLFG